MRNLKQTLDIERDLHKQGRAPRGSLHLHNVRAEFTHKQDIETDTGLDYGLENDTRDRLPAHRRQDVESRSLHRTRGRTAWSSQPTLIDSDSCTPVSVDMATLADVER